MRCPNILLIVIILLAAHAQAEIIQSGDGGATFATDMSFQKCAEPNVAAVYLCSGNVVQVVSSVQGEGSTFYKPDGRAVYCPDVPPADMGAECVQLFGPNLCTPDNVCPPPAQNTGTGAAPQEAQPPKKNQTSQSQQVTQPAGNDTITIVPLSVGGISERDVYIFAIVIVGMMLLAGVHYYYLKKQSSDAI